MRITVLKNVIKELAEEPKQLKENLFGILDRLEQGENIPKPLCCPLFSIAKRLYEIRLSDEMGEFRVFYYIKIGDAIYVIHAKRKKTQKIDKKTIRLLQKRIRSL